MVNNKHDFNNRACPISTPYVPPYIKSEEEWFSLCSCSTGTPVYLPAPSDYVEITREEIENDQDFQRYTHENRCIPFGVHLCKACFKILMEESLNDRKQDKEMQRPADSSIQDQKDNDKCHDKSQCECYK